MPDLQVAAKCAAFALGSKLKLTTHQAGAEEVAEVALSSSDYTSSKVGP